MANNNMKKVIATMLAVSMMASHGGVVNAFAEGDVQVSGSSTTVVSGSGTLEDPNIVDEIKTESSTDLENNETTTKTENKSEWYGEEENEDSYTTIEGEEKSESTVVTDEEGNILEGSGSTEGSETLTEESFESNSDEKEPVVEESEEISEGEWSEPEATGDLEAVGEPEQKGEAVEGKSENITIDSEKELSAELNPGEEESVSAEENNAALLDAYKAALGEEYANAEFEELYDESGNFKGYRIVNKGEIVEGEPVVSGDPVEGEWSEENFEEISSDKEISEGNIVNESKEIVLPAKPEASESVDEASGKKTVVTVSEIYDPNDSSKVIGYSKSTVVTDAEGNELSSANENIYGTVVTKVTTEYTETSTKEEQSTQTRTVTQTYVSSAEQLITTEEIKWNELSNRNMTASMGKVQEGENNGDTEMKSLDSKYAYDVKNPPSSEWLSEYAYKFIGNVDQWGYEVNTDDGESSPVQLLLVDEKGNVHIVYCADLETYTQDNYRYDMENVFEANYYNQDEAEMIVAIASNGFWGTEEGLGSMEAVRKFLKENSDLTESEINKLTEKEAITATQAAIWKYGNSGDTLLDENKISDGNDYWDWYNNKWNTDSSSRIQALYEALTGITPEEAESIANLNPVVATEETFATSSVITVGGKSEAEEYAEVNNDDNSENDVYDTSIEFTMAFMPTANDDLIVQVLDGDKVIAQRRLSAEKSIGAISPSSTNALGEHVYVIDDLPLAEGVNITLNLNGTQNLGQGVYLYSSEIKGGVSSQTFVGIAQGTREVNLNVNLKFEVNEPNLSYNKTTSESVQNYEREYEASREDVKVISRVTTNEVIYEDTETEKVTVKEWSSEWSIERAPEEIPTVTPPPGPPQDGDNPIEEDNEDEEELSNIPDEDVPLTNIPDEDVPLTNIPDEPVPLTGAASMWNMIALISLGGLVAVNAAEKKNKK